jgi:chaperonin GroEL
MSKILLFSKQARETLLSGITQVADSVGATLGPNGRNVIYRDESGEVRSTKDGVTVAKMISFKDPSLNMAADLIKQASIKTGNSAGDGTTTSTVLGYSMAKQGLEKLTDPTVNAVTLKRDIEKAVEEVVQFLKTNLVEDISSEEQLEQIATISANNDPNVGKLITSALEAVGIEGIITIEESRTGETYLEIVEGVQFDRGYRSPYFVTDNATMRANLDNPYILLYDGKVSQAKDLVNILNYCAGENKSLLIVAEDIDHEALATLIVNKMQGTIKVCAVKAPDFGDRRKLILQDIAILTGGTVVSPERGMKLQKMEPKWLGTARKVTVQKETTTIIDGAGEAEEITKRVEELKQQIEGAVTPFEKEKLQERLGKITGGVAIIHVGGLSELEMRETKDRVEDALHATRAAMAEGIVPGGGVALLKAAKSLEDRTEPGYKIVQIACTAPFYKILSNAGMESPMIAAYQSEVENLDWKGWHIVKNQAVDMKAEGIIDPFRVTRTALENAASVAGTVLLTECIIADEENSKPAEDPQQMLFG